MVILLQLLTGGRWREREATAPAPGARQRPAWPEKTRRPVNLRLSCEHVRAGSIRGIFGDAAAGPDGPVRTPSRLRRFRERPAGDGQAAARRAPLVAAFGI